MSVRARRRDIGPDSKICKFSGNSEAVNQPALPLSWGGFTCGSAGGPRHIQPFAQYAGRMAGTNAGGRGAGTSAARFRILPLTRLPRIWWGSAQHVCYVGPMAFHREADDPYAHLAVMNPDATPGLEPAMRCWEILTVAPQRRCLDSDMRLESCRRHDRTSQITWPR